MKPRLMLLFSACIGFLYSLGQGDPQRLHTSNWRSSNPFLGEEEEKCRLELGAWSLEERTVGALIAGCSRDSGG